MQNTVVILVSVLVGITALVLTLGVARLLRKNSQDEDFDKQLAELRRSEFDTSTEGRPDGLNSWSGYWYDLASKTGVDPTNKTMPGRIAIIMSLVALGIGTMIWPGDIFGGIVFGILAVGGYRVYLVSQANKRIKKMDALLPRLLEGMRANLQAGSTAQQAILSVVDEVPEPLGEELKILREEMNVNISLDQALRNLAKRVPSREMAFLVASIEIAVQSGSDLDPQLEIIQKIMVQRTRITQRLAAAVAEVTPSIWVSALIIPFGLGWSLYSSETNRDFWMSGMGIICLAIIAVLYVAGMFISRRFVRSVENT